MLYRHLPLSMRKVEDDALQAVIGLEFDTRAPAFPCLDKAVFPPVRGTVVSGGRENAMMWIWCGDPARRPRQIPDLSWLDTRTGPLPADICA